jgi:2-polyprenyl-3-methyl-5-hydroxy-6-metoxy-1,4-benzoquinol methylase
MWDDRYNRADYFYGKQPNDFVRQVCPQIPKGKILCLAEGEGRNAVYLAQQGYRVTAVDASEVGIAKAQRLAAEHGVPLQTIVTDLAEFEIRPQSWDGIVAIFCHLPPPLRAQIHRQVVEGLRPGGVFVLEAYTPAQLNFKTGGPPVAELMMDWPTLQQELAGLTFNIGEELERDIHEGIGHRGHSAVVQVFGVKPAI